MKSPGLSVLAALGGFQLGAFFGNLFGALLAGAVAFYWVWTALRRSCLLFGRTPLFFARYGLRSRRLGAVLCAIDR